MNFLNNQHLVSHLRIQLLLTVIFLFFFSKNLQAQPQLEWSNVLGGTLNDIPHAVQLTSDDGFIVVGQSNSSDGNVAENKGGFDLWITRLDEDGNLLWEKNYGGSADDYAMDIQKTTDGGYVLVGGTASNDFDVSENKGVVDVWIIKIGADGNLLWSKTFGGAGVDFGSSIQVLADGYIIAGCTGSAGDSDVSSGYGSNEFWVLKISLTGNLLWEKTYGGSRHDAAKKIEETSDGGFLVAGNTWSSDGDISNAQGQSDAWIIKIDAAGVLQWDKSYGTNQPDILNDFSKTNDGNFVFAGNKTEFDTIINGFYGRYDEQIWMTKISPTGQEIFSKIYGGEGYDRANSVEATIDGGYIIGGNVRSKTGDFEYQAGHDDIFLIKTNPQGIEEWTKLIGGEENEVVKSVLPTDDGGYLMLAYSSSTYVDTTFVKIGFEDWWMIKFAGNSVSVNLGGDQTVCENETITLDATVSGCNCTYLWGDGNMNPTRDVTLSSTTMFSVTVTDPSGLEGTDLMTVFVSVPQFNLDVVNVNCADFENGSATLMPLESGYSFEWNDGSMNAALTGIGGGTYTYTVTDGNGCQITDQAIITEPQPILISENITEVDCFGNNNGSIDLSVNGGTGSYQYAWEGGQDAQDIFNLTAGGYTVTVSDMNGCIKIQDWIVNEPPSINIGANPFSTLCFDSEDGGATMSVNGGEGNLTYLWSNNSNNKNLENVPSGTYTLTVTDENFCQKTATVVIDSPAEIMIQTTVQDASCFGNNDGSITTNVNGGQGTYQFQWADGSATPNRSQLSSGTYTLTVTDGNMCEKIKEIVVSQNSSISISAQINPITCHDSENGLIDLTATGGTGNLNFMWNVGNQTEDIGNLPAGDYIVTVTDNLGCEAIELFTVPAVDSIIITETIFPVQCNGDNNGIIQVEASGGNGSFNYSWNGGSNTSTIGNLFAGEYTVTATDLNGCEKIETFLLPEPEPIVITQLVITGVSCHGGSDGAFELSVDGGVAPYLIDWSVPGNSNLSSGNYSVTVIDANACMLTETFFIPEPDELVVDFQVSNPMNGDDGSITSQVTGGTPPFEFNWNDSTWVVGDISDLPGGTYDLILTDGNGCTVEESLFLEPIATFEIENLTTFDIFPNPSNGTFFIKIELEKREKIEVIITDELGRTVERFLRNDDFILEKNTLENIAAGMYFIMIKTESGVAVKKLIVQ